MRRHDPRRYIQAVRVWKWKWPFLNHRYLTIGEWKEYSSRNISNDIFFMIVRHPFERLVSAYRYIFETGSSAGKPMVKRFRHSNEDTKYLFMGTQNRHKLIKERKNWLSKFPTFGEFVRSILKNWSADDNKHPFGNKHWRPIYQHCSICHQTTLSTLKYVLKYEDLAAEQAAFIQMENWSSIISDPVRVNVHHPPTLKHHLTSRKLTHLYTSTLPKHLIRGLYEKYKPDFLLFNYTFNIHDWVWM